MSIETDIDSRVPAYPPPVRCPVCESLVLRDGTLLSRGKANETIIKVETPDVLYVLTTPVKLSKELYDLVTESLIEGIKNGLVVLDNGAQLAVHKFY